MATVRGRLRIIEEGRIGTLGSGSAALLLTAGTFVVGDVGSLVTIEGAGVGGGDLYTSITAFTNATNVTLADVAATAVAGADVRLVIVDANTAAGLHLGPGLDWGSPGIAKSVLHQPGKDGEEETPGDRTNAQARIQLIILEQASYDAVADLHEVLLDALEAGHMHVWEWTPEGDPAATLVDAYRPETLPALHRGQTVRPDCTLYDGYIPIEVSRLPNPRGYRRYL